MRKAHGRSGFKNQNSSTAPACRDPDFAAFLNGLIIEKRNKPESD
jgi:uncharacterized protein YehS (DUF1456 family)